MDGKDILLSQSRFNRLLYQQKIADQESISASAKYAGYDASAGMGKIIDVEGNIRYVKSSTTGGVGRDGQIRVRHGENFGGYDAMPSRKQPQQKEIPAAVIYRVKTLFHLLDFEAETTTFYLGGDRKQIKIKPASELSEISPQLNFDIRPGTFNLLYTQGFIINLGGNKSKYFIYDYHYYLSVINNQLSILEPGDPPRYYLGNGIWEKGNLGIYWQQPQSRISIAESIIRNDPITLNPLVYKGIEYPTNKITTSCWNGTFSYQESFNSDPNKLYGVPIVFADTFIYVDPDGFLRTSGGGLSVEELVLQGWSVRISRSELISIKNIRGLADTFEATFRVTYNNTTQTIMVRGSDYSNAIYWDVTDNNNWVSLGLQASPNYSIFNGVYLFTLGFGERDTKFADWANSNSNAQINDNIATRINDFSSLIPLIPSGEKDFKSTSMFTAIADQTSITQSPILCFHNGYFKENVQTKSQLIFKITDEDTGDGVVIRETKNIATSITFGEQTINTDDFLCASRRRGGDAAYPWTTQFTAIFGTDEIKEFDPSYLVGMDVVYPQSIDNYIKGTIVSADFQEIFDQFDSGELLLTIAVNEYVSAPMSFTRTLITNSSYYSYHFRKYNRESNFAYNFQNQFLCKQARPALSLSPLSKSVFTTGEDEASLAFLLAETDNLVGNKIYSVIKRLDTLKDKKIWVEEWEIMNDGRIIFNKVFRENYYTLKRPENTGLSYYSHSYHP